MTHQPAFDSEEALAREIHSLVLACFGSTASEAERRRLEELVRTDPAARRLYLRFAHDSLMLHRWATAESGSPEGADAVPIEAIALLDTQAETSPLGANYGFGHFAFTGGVFEGTPFAYVAATLLIGVGLLVGSLVQVSHFGQPVAQRPLQPANRPSADASKDIVACVTATVGCRFADRASVAPDGANVALGRRFALTSGLIEITYNTGAKVILQGPVTYEITAADSGYLSLGRLTARVEKRGEGKEERGEELASNGTTAESPSSSNPQSLIPNPSLPTAHEQLFTINTPSATVTDLGTEFGVEVSKSGSVSAHVFRGEVEFRSDRGTGQAVRLQENQSAAVRDGEQPMRSQAVDPSQFVRGAELSERVAQQKFRSFRRWQAYSRRLRQDPALVAYYTFESPGADASVLANASAAGIALDGKIEGPAWTTGRFSGKSALRFHGEGSSDRVVLPDQERFNFSGPFTAAVWYKIEQKMLTCQSLLTKGDRAWRLHRWIDSHVLCLSFDSTFQLKGSLGDVSNSSAAIGNEEAGLTEGSWHLAVIVGEPDAGRLHKYLYIDGYLNADNVQEGCLRRTDDPVWIGNNSARPDRAFQGLIDEVAIFSRRLTAPEIFQMFQTGNPPASEEAVEIKRP